MAPERDSLAIKLRTAMIREGLVYNGKPSARALALRLAGDRADDRRVVDDYRKQVRRWLKDGQKGVQARTAVMLADALNTSVEYWPISYPEARSNRRGIEVAEDLVRRLDAGESVPRELRERVAAQLDETSELCARLANRLRASGEAAHSAA